MIQSVYSKIISQQNFFEKNRLLTWERTHAEMPDNHNNVTIVKIKPLVEVISWISDQIFATHFCGYCN